MREPCIYMMASRRNGTLYTGGAIHLARRAFEHRSHVADGFTARYGCDLLVYYEFFPTMLEAIGREKQIKAGSRAKKIALIERMNPLWRDLYFDLA